jgi:hypothetical protein
VTQEEEEDLLERLGAIIGLKENEKRTGEQVVLGKLQVINLNYL